VERAALLRELVDLAHDAGLEVRPGGRTAGGEGDVALSSGVCRLRGRVWVVLAAGDSLEDQIEVMSGALRSHAAAFLEGRWLPPAVRDCLHPQEIS